MDHQHMTRRQLLALGAGGGLAALVALSPPAGAAPRVVGAAKAKGAMHIVAHPDDALLFLNPDQQRDIVSGRPVQIVYLTAGENTFDATYWQAREVGALAAAASLAGVANAWTPSIVPVNGFNLLVQQLTAKPTVTIVFMRLPDGNADGSGFPLSNNQSLQSLWTGTIAAMDAVDGSASYDKSGLIATLVALMAATRPLSIRTQDFINTFGGGDHSDHYAAGAFVQAANAAYVGSRRTLYAYMGYPASSQPVNVASRKYQAKTAAWLAYAPNDELVPQTIADANQSVYGSWLARQYQSGHIVS